MCARIPLSSVIIAMAVITSVSAQSLPDQAGPLLGHKSSTSQQEGISNPSGFGKSAKKAIDRDRTRSNRSLACKQHQDIRDAPSAKVEDAKDCVR